MSIYVLDTPNTQSKVYAHSLALSRGYSMFASQCPAETPRRSRYMSRKDVSEITDRMFNEDVEGCNDTDLFIT